jgi:uncharacterized protein YdiU (UPF0061 family)
MADSTARDLYESLVFENRFATLPKDFYTLISPSAISAPYLISVNQALAAKLGLSEADTSSSAFTDIFSGNQVAKTSRPLAAVYSGHQFGVWAGQLGDGRAHLLGTLATATQDMPALFEVQLKGAGSTPYSRMGDGRAVLRSSIREYLCSEAMAALHIPSSRALCLIGSDQYVMREQPETSAVVARVAESFIRFGSFEHWYYNNKPEQLKILADYVLQHYFANLLKADNPYAALLAEVVKRTAELMAHWQAVGFMHGVMNTDNMSILGMTLDYGPFGFMDAYNPNHICNHTDVNGRYAYAMQPRIGQWNCHALAQALLPLIGDVETTQEQLTPYQAIYEQKMRELHHLKFGFSEFLPEDDTLFQDFLVLMTQNHADYTISFRQLSRIVKEDASQDDYLRDLFIDRDALNQWLLRYRARLQIEKRDNLTRQSAMNQVNPKYILRNHLVQIAIEKAQQKDFSEVNRLLSILENPFDEQPEYNAYAELPPDWASTLEVSCSS